MFEDEDCERCSINEFNCIKANFPQTGSKQLGDQNTTIHLPSALALIVDSELTEQQNSYLRNLYNKHGSQALKTCTSVILQHLWDTYGAVFTDKPLLYAVMAWASSFDTNQIELAARLRDHRELRAQLKRAIGEAVREGEISESLLFASFFAILTHFHEVKDDNVREFSSDNPDLTLYLQVFLGFLRKLNLDRALNLNSTPSHLQYLYNYVLSLIRLWASEGTEPHLNYLLTLAAENIPIPDNVPDNRATFALPARFWLNKSGSLNWQGLEWSVSDDIRALHSCFQMMINLDPTKKTYTSYSSQIAGSLGHLAQKVTDMRKLGSVAEIFRMVLPRIVHK